VSNNGKPGPKTKASKGEKKHKKLSITLPPKLWELVEIERKPGEGNSKLIQRLLKQAIAYSEKIG